MTSRANSLGPTANLNPEWTPELVRNETVSFRERLFALHDEFFNANRALMIEELERNQLEIEAA
jgi:hypothetical protein